VSDPDLPPEVARRVRNLQAVARYHALSSSGAADAKDAAPRAAQPTWLRRLGTLGPLGLALAFVAGKLKLLLPILKFANLGTLLTMLLAVWAYAVYWGWPFAVGFVLLIFVHEMGHALAMRQLGLQAGAPVFIPFVGAVIAMKSQPHDAYAEAQVGIGGPFLGGLAALLCLVVAVLTGSLFWYSLASTGFLINLFNLIPISPLDGGRIVGVLSRWIWVAGYAIGVGAFLWTRSPILFLILVVGLFSLPRTVRGPRAGYFAVPTRRRLSMGAAYFGLLAALALAMWITARPLGTLRLQ
jgi:Zn-dependent protease